MNNGFCWGFIIVIFFSCRSDVVYEKHEKVGHQNNWKKDTPIHFAFELDSGYSYVLHLAIRYAEGYPYTNLWVNAKVWDPEGNVTSQKVIIPLRNEEGGYLGEGLGDIYDVDYPLEKFFIRGFGKYKMKVANVMPYDAPLIMEAGVVVRRSFRQ
jgi:gliding motility-associated lipoprotein GldH